MTALAASLLASATLGLVSAQAGGPSRVDTVRRTFPAVASRLDPREAPTSTHWSDRGRRVDGWRGAHVRLPRLASDPQVAEGEGVTIVRRPRDARAVPAAEIGGHLVYADAWPHTDVLQATGPEWTEELLHLRNRRAPREFAYELLARGVATAGIEDGAVRFLDAAGRGLVLTRPIVIDATGRRSATAARWILAPPGEGGSRRLTLRLDPVGLDYPLLVDPAWIPTGSLNTPRNNPLGILLQTGKVLVMAGFMTAQATAELYDPASGRWSYTGPLPFGFQDHAAVLLRNGRVLVAGGTAADALPNCHLYDSQAGSWSSAAPMNTPRRRHSLTLLPDGRVLAVGGLTTGTVRTATAEIYDPTANAWTPVADASVARWGHFAVLLRDGRVLVAAGDAIVADLKKTEIFDPATGLWTPAGDLTVARGDLASGTLLPDGRVLAAGGNGPSSSELFDPATGLWSPTGPLAGPRSYHSATLLPSGKVVVVGGFAGANLATTEVYDPGTGQWSAGPTLATARRRHSATMMPDGRVLVAGGDGPLATAELLEIDAPSWAAPCARDRGAQRGDGDPAEERQGAGGGRGGPRHGRASRPGGEHLGPDRQQHGPAPVAARDGDARQRPGPRGRRAGGPDRLGRHLRPAHGPVGGCGLPGQRALEPHRHAAPVRRGARGRGRGLERRRGDRRRALQPAPRAVGPDRRHGRSPHAAHRDPPEGRPRPRDGRLRRDGGGGHGRDLRPRDRRVVADGGSHVHRPPRPHGDAPAVGQGAGHRGLRRRHHRRRSSTRPPASSRRPGSTTFAHDIGLDGHAAAQRARPRRGGLGTRFARRRCTTRRSASGRPCPRPPSSATSTSRPSSRTAGCSWRGAGWRRASRSTTRAGARSRRGGPRRRRGPTRS